MKNLNKLWKKKFKINKEHLNILIQEARTQITPSNIYNKGSSTDKIQEVFLQKTYMNS